MKWISKHPHLIIFKSTAGNISITRKLKKKNVDVTTCPLIIQDYEHTWTRTNITLHQTTSKSSTENTDGSREGCERPFTSRPPTLRSTETVGDTHPASDVHFPCSVTWPELVEGCERPFTSRPPTLRSTKTVGDTSCRQRTLPLFSHMTWACFRAMWTELHIMQSAHEHWWRRLDESYAVSSIQISWVHKFIKFVYYID